MIERDVTVILIHTTRNFEFAFNIAIPSLGLDSIKPSQLAPGIFLSLCVTLKEKLRVQVETPASLKKKLEEKEMATKNKENIHASKKFQTFSIKVFTHFGTVEAEISESQLHFKVSPISDLIFVGRC
jgi:hypothetical protein